MIVQTMRQWRPFAWPSLTVLALIIVLLLTVVWWRDENRHGPTCTIAMPQITMVKDVRGYVELSLKKQDPIEPTFESDLFIRLETPPVSPPSEVTVTRSAVGIYLQSFKRISLQRDGLELTHRYRVRVGKNLT